jgi:hypothetical protein
MMAVSANLPISPLAGEMSDRTEGGAVPPTSRTIPLGNRQRWHSTLPPFVLPDISPAWGEIGSFDRSAN